jgi:hypothetical protein
MTSLLQTAITSTHRGRSTKHTYSAEEIDLAVGWLNETVSYKQVCAVLNRHGSNLYNFIAIALREAYRQGKLSTK